MIPRLIAGLGGLALVALLVVRLRFCLEQPALVGADAYARLWLRDEVFTGLFGRRWPPALQSLVWANYRLGGGLESLRLLLGILGAAMPVAFGLLVARHAGTLAGLVAAGALAVDADSLWAAQSVYQEPLFYTLVCAALLGVPREGEVPRGSVVLLGLACLTRYEGIILVAVIGGALAWRGRRAGVGPVMKRLMFWVAIPFVLYLLFSGGQDDHHSALSRGLELEAIQLNLQYLGQYVGTQPALVWFASGLTSAVTVGVLARRGGRRLHPLVSISHGFVVADMLLYVLAAPYVPTDNRRFHIPLSIWAYGWGAAGVGLAVTRLARWRLPVGWGVGIVCVAGIGVAGWSQWNDSKASVRADVRRMRKPASIGTLVGRTVPEQGLVALTWPRKIWEDDYPSLFDMRISAYVDGPARRVEYLDPEALAHAALREGRPVAALARTADAARVADTFAGLGAPFYRIGVGSKRVLFSVGAPEEGSLPPPLVSALGAPPTRVVAGGDKLRVHDLRFLSGKWPSPAELIWEPEGPGVPLELEVVLSERRERVLHLGLSTGPRRGRFDVALDGETILEVDAYTPRVDSRGIPAPSRLVEAGAHRITITPKLRNPRSKGDAVGIFELWL